MSKAYLALAAAGALAVVELARAQSGTPPGVPWAEEIVTARQAAMSMSGEVLGAMKTATNRGEEAKTQDYPAYGLARWAKALAGLFPIGVGADAGAVKMRARPEVWSDRAGFEKAAADFMSESEKLRGLARANDTDGFKAQLLEVQETCTVCHRAYRTGPPG